MRKVATMLRPKTRWISIVLRNDRRDQSSAGQATRFRSVCQTAAKVSFALGLVMMLASMVSLAVGAKHNPATTSLRDYVRGIASGDEAFDLGTATTRVYQGIVHEEPRHVGLTENWLQAGLGLLYTPIKTTQDTDRLLAGGIANCSERSQILKTIAESAGYDCRFVGLEGHVVLEVYAGGRWRMADPDYGVVFDLGVDSMALLEQQPVVIAALASHGHSGQTVSTYLQILQSTEDNTWLAVGSPLSPRLHAIEQACAWLIWIMPTTAILVGLSPRLASRAIRAASLKRRIDRREQVAAAAIGMFAHAESERG